MSLASELRDLYTPEQPTPAQIDTLEIVTQDVGTRNLLGKTIVSHAVETELRGLIRMRDLVNYYAPGGPSEKGQPTEPATAPATDEEAVERYYQQAENERMYMGFRIGSEMFFSAVGEIGLYDHPGLKAELKNLTDNPRIFPAVQNTVALQHDERLGDELTREWSENFPALAFITSKLYENRMYVFGEAFERGMAEGLHYAAAPLARLALSAEMPDL